MNIYYTIDEKYMKAIEKLDWGKIPKAKLLLESILEDEPGYGKAHFQMACIYYYELSEYEKAQRHYELAIRFSPEYQDAYKHYMFMLNYLEMHEELEILGEKALKVRGVCKAEIYNQLGISYEKNKNWDKAIQYFREAYLCALKDSEMEMYDKNIIRVKDKKRCLKKYDYVSA